MKTKTKTKFFFLIALSSLLTVNTAIAQSTTTGNAYSALNFLGWGATSGDLPFKVNNNTKMILKNTTGYLGLGTTSPLGMFHATAANGAGSWVYFTGNVSSTNPSTTFTGGLALGYNVRGTCEANFVSGSADCATAGGFRFQNWAYGSGGTLTDLVTILGTSGNTGIGTTAPASKLDVEGGIAVGATYSGTTAAPTNGAIIEGNTGIGTSAPSTINGIASVTGKIFNLGNASGRTILNSEGTTEANFSLVSTSSPTNQKWLLIRQQSGKTIFAPHNDAGSSLYNAIVIQHSNGYVGINNNAPTHQLTVSGIIRSIHDTAYKNVAGSWSGWSDQRLKKDIALFEDGLNVLRNVQPKTYKFNGIGNLSATETHIGVIAQDIKNIAPYCIGEGGATLKVKQSEAQNFSGAEIIETLPPDSTGEVYVMVSPLTYNYDGLIYVMINSIKQLDSTNTALMKKDSLLTKNDSIKDAEILALQNLTTLYDTKFQQMQNKINQLDSIINSCCSIGSTRSMLQNSDESEVISSKDVELTNQQVIVLFQNSPNPFKEQTTIEYYLPNNVQKAQILFLEQSGKLIKTVDLTEKGKGILNVFANDLTSGTYTYSLIVDGQTVETKKMVKTK